MKLILFGAGERLQSCLKNSITCGHEILAIADNDSKKQGMRIAFGDNTSHIISPTKIPEYDFDMVAITTSKHKFWAEIFEQLEQLGVSRDKTAFFNPMGEMFYCPKILPPPNTDSIEPPIYYDVSIISDFDRKTGIQREVNMLYPHLKKLYPNIVPSRMFLGEYITSNKFQANIEGLDYNYKEHEVFLYQGAKALLPDMTWATDYKRLFEKFKAGNTKSYVVMYDIIPILQKHLYPSMHRVFQPYVDFILREADAFVCISQTVAENIADYYSNSHAIREKPLPLYVFHEGFDIGNSAVHIRPQLREFIKKEKTLLTVGMNSPRKNHLLTAIVIYNIMQNDCTFNGNLLFIGRHVKEEQEQFETIVGRTVDRILWIEDAEDNELCYAYENSRALVFATSSEGFGLPLIEAAYFGLPILASDIPIFREIAEDNALYFKPDDTKSLRETIMRYWRGEIIAPNSKNIRLYTWEDSAREILDIMVGNTEPYKVLDRYISASDIH